MRKRENMGVDFYLAYDESEELFELGKGMWEDLHSIDEKSLKSSVVDNLLHRADDVDGKQYARMGVKLSLDWCRDREWKVYLVSDYDEKYDKVSEWPVTGSLYDIPKMTVEDIQVAFEKKAKEILEEYGLDSVRITGVTEDMPILDEYPLLAWEIFAETSYAKQSSGFHRVKIDRDYPLDEDENDRRR